MIEVAMKRCGKCGEEKTLSSEFWHRLGSGWQTYCKACRSQAKPKPEVPEGHKFCPKCKTAHPATTEFFRPRAKSQGGPRLLLGQCRECLREKERAERQVPEVKEARNLATRKWAAKRKSRTPQPSKGVHICPRCNTPKPHTLDFFGKDAIGPSGMNRYCRKCVNEKDALARRKNPNRHKSYVEKNRERVRAYRQDWYLKNRISLRSRENARRKNPEVIQQLKTYIHKRRARKMAALGQFTRGDVTNKLILQGNRCYYCSKLLQEMHIDHKIPISRGGTNWPANICLACPTCNLRKHNKTPQEFRAYLAKT